MARPCNICASSDNRRIADAMIVEGATDAAIAARIQVGRMSVARHRANHVIRPAEAALAIANKGAPLRRERQDLERAAASDRASPAEIAKAALSMEAIAGRLRKVERRLESASQQAVNAPTALAALAGQHVRSLEFAARLGGVGGYAPAKVQPGGGAGFAVNIIFSGGGAGQPEVVTIAPLDTLHGGDPE